MFAVEKTIIEDWLEIEVDLTALGTTGHTELSGDILFKKPFHISPTFEFMIGVGPSFSRALTGEDQSTIVSAEFALDFMFWPTKDLGWFFEPTWTVNPRNGQQSFAASVGGGFRLRPGMGAWSPPGPKLVGIEGKQTEMTRLLPVARARSRASPATALIQASVAERRLALATRERPHWSTLTKGTSTTRASGFGRRITRCLVPALEVPLSISSS